MQPIQQAITTHIFPSFKGLLLVGAPWLLSVTAEPVRQFTDLGWWGMMQWGVSILVAGYGLYDFHLKIRYKHRQERLRKEEERKQTHNDDGGKY